MFATIRNAIIAFFTATTTLATAVNKAASSLDALADIALDESQHHRDKRRAERAAQLEQL